MVDMDDRVKRIYKVAMSPHSTTKIVLQKLFENNIEGFFSPIPGVGFRAYKLQKDKWDWLVGSRVIYLENNKWYYIRTKGDFFLK